MTDAFPVIESKRLILRQFTQQDLEHVFLGLSNPDVVRYYGVHYDTLEATKEQLTWFRDLESSGKGLWWAICAKADNSFLGAGGLNDLDKKNRKAEIGFWLLPDYWGKGIMGEAMPLICNYGFKQLGLHRIEGFVETGNKKVKKALAKLHFKYEGTMAECEVKDGRYISLEIYSLLEGH